MEKIKGQIAMEFMMTYLWGIIVVLAGVGAMVYFGVFDNAFFPEEITSECCEDFCQEHFDTPCYAWNEEQDYFRCWNGLGTQTIMNESTDYSIDNTIRIQVYNITGVCGNEN